MGDLNAKKIKFGIEKKIKITKSSKDILMRFYCIQHVHIVES